MLKTDGDFCKNEFYRKNKICSITGKFTYFYMSCKYICCIKINKCVKNQYKRNYLNAF